MVPIARLEKDEFRVSTSSHIVDFMSDARQYAARHSVIVEFGWCCTIRVSKSTNIVELYRDWEASQLMNWAIIGPTTAPFYSTELKKQLHQRQCLLD
jgi:hypothetical protein